MVCAPSFSRGSRSNFSNSRTRCAEAAFSFQREAGLALRQAVFDLSPSSVTVLTVAVLTSTYASERGGLCEQIELCLGKDKLLERGKDMKPFPHSYTVTGTANSEGHVALDSQKLPRLVTAPPTEYGGPGDRWSPETLLVAAVADCFVLTFRAIAAVAKLSWISLHCEVTGTLDRVEHVTQFTGFIVRARLELSPETNKEQALRMLTKAEQTCLVTNSLKAKCQLEASVDFAVAA